MSGIARLFQNATWEDADTHKELDKQLDSGDQQGGLSLVLAHVLSAGGFPRLSSDIVTTGSTTVDKRSFKLRGTIRSDPLPVRS